MRLTLEVSDNADDKSRMREHYTISVERDDLGVFVVALIDPSDAGLEAALDCALRAMRERVLVEIARRP